MRLTRPVTDIIRMRCSWRTYDGRLLDETARTALEEHLSRRDDGPFGIYTYIQIVDTSGSAAWVTRAFGTYGVISGARQFIAGAVERSGKDLENYGYIFEKAVLFATDLGLGTCWMGGTFSQSRFADKIGLKPGEILPAVSPVGYKKGRRGLLDALMHRVVGSANRKPWSSLFFHKNFDTPISEAVAGSYSTPLEMVRLAPSAVNGQPWRIVKEEGGNVFHFYRRRQPSRSKTYSIFIPFDLQRIDMGIAMCHFELTAEELHLKGKWEVHQPDIGELPKGIEYVVSWIEGARPQRASDFEGRIPEEPA